MKRILLAASVAAAALSSAQAESYIQVHLGGFQQTEDTVAFASENFLGSVLDQDLDSDADVGLAIGGLVGHYVLPFIALEGEVTMRTANIDDVSLNGIQASIDDDLRTIAFMGNAVIRPTFPLLPDPYVGIGVGYLTSNLETVDGGDADGQFAYQLKAGISFGIPLFPGTIGLEANYLATDDFDLGGTVNGDIINADYGYGGVSGLINWKIGF